MVTRQLEYQLLREECTSIMLFLMVFMAVSTGSISRHQSVELRTFKYANLSKDFSDVKGSYKTSSSIMMELTGYSPPKKDPPSTRSNAGLA